MQNTRQKNRKCFIEVRHCLITLIEKYSRIENCRTFGALLTNLSKAFNCLSHELLFANWMQMDQAKSIMQMQINSSQSLMLKTKSKKKNIYSSRGEMLFGVPQDPILRSSLFNILICEMFFFLRAFDNAKCTGNSTPYNAGKSGILLSITFKQLKYFQLQFQLQS